MKKGVLYLFVLINLLQVNALKAQSYEGLNLGFGIDYGSEVEEAGLDLRLGYFLTDQINIVFDMNFFFLNDDGRYITNRYFNEYNINAHYYFPIKPKTGESIISPYGLAGLNLSSFGTKYDDHPVFGDERISNTELGLNIGAGCDFNLSTNLKPFFELKYLFIENADQGEVALGVKYFFE